MTHKDKTEVRVLTAPTISGSQIREDRKDLNTGELKKVNKRGSKPSRGPKVTMIFLNAKTKDKWRRIERVTVQNVNQRNLFTCTALHSPAVMGMTEYRVCSMKQRISRRAREAWTMRTAGDNMTGATDRGQNTGKSQNTGSISQKPDSMSQNTDRSQNTDTHRTMGITMNTVEKENLPENTPRKEDILVGIVQKKDIVENTALKSDKVNPTEKDLMGGEMGTQQQKGPRALKDGRLLLCLYHP